MPSCHLRGLKHRLIPPPQAESHEARVFSRRPLHRDTICAPNWFLSLVLKLKSKLWSLVQVLDVGQTCFQILDRLPNYLMTKDTLFNALDLMKRRENNTAFVLVMSTLLTAQLSPFISLKRTNLESFSVLPIYHTNEPSVRDDLECFSSPASWGSLLFPSA